LRDQKTNVNFVTVINLSTNFESLMKIGPTGSQIFGAICQFFTQYLGQLFTNFHCLRQFNSNTAEPIFTMFLHDVEELLQILMHAFQSDIAFCFQMQDQRVKAVNFNVAQCS